MGLCVVSFMLGLWLAKATRKDKNQEMWVRMWGLGLVHGLGGYVTYTGNEITSTQITKKIRCAHQNRLKCAPTRAPKDCLAGATTPAPVSASSTWVFVTDILSSLGVCVLVGRRVNCQQGVELTWTRQNLPSHAPQIRGKEKERE